jgi:hypothetical protein
MTIVHEWFCSYIMSAEAFPIGTALGNSRHRQRAAGGLQSRNMGFRVVGDPHRHTQGGSA